MATVLVSLAGLSSCGKERTADVPGQTPTPGNASANPGVGSTYTKEVLPGSTHWLNREITHTDAPIVVAHDVPRMDREAAGPYSYLGAEREFETICGFPLPSWIEPVSGEYSVSLRSQTRNAWVSHALIHYQTDPARREELANLISGAYSRRWPERAPLQWFLEKPPSVAPEHMAMGFRILDGSNRLFDVRIIMHADGRVSISNARGEVD